MVIANSGNTKQSWAPFSKLCQCHLPFVVSIPLSPLQFCRPPLPLRERGRGEGYYKLFILNLFFILL